MSCGSKINITICRGTTFSMGLHPANDRYIYKAISGITQAAPVSIHVPGHGLTEGWPVAVVTTTGMSELAAVDNPPAESDYHLCSITDADHITLNDVNSTLYAPYISGGAVQFSEPRDLSTDQARFILYDQKDGTAKLTLTSSPAAGVTVDDAAKTITVTITDEQTTTLIAGGYYYETQLLTQSGEVFGLSYGKALVT